MHSKPSHPSDHRALDRQLKTPSSASLSSTKRRRGEVTKSPPPSSETIESVTAPAIRGRRTSINMFDSDLDFLEPLRVYLRKQTGLRVIRDSTLLQVLCRGYTPGPEHVEALAAVEALDGRRQNAPRESRG